MAFERHVEAFGLNGEGPRVVVSFAVHQENGILDVIRIPERRHPGVEIRHFPERAPLVLKTEWGERTIVRAAFRESRAEQPRVRQQVRRHESAVAVTTDADAIAIGDAHFDGFIYRRLCAGHELIDIRVVGRLTRADDRHRRIVEHRVAGQ